MQSLFALLVIILVLVVVGCSSSPQTSMPSSTAAPQEEVVATQPPDAASTDQGEPQLGGILLVAYDEEPRVLDFHKASATASRVTFNMNIGDTLLFIDENGELQPWLAESWEQESDTTYIFHIREGVTFHDGTPLDAEAVKFNFDRLVDPETISPRANLFPIESTEVVDPLTVRFTLTVPMAPFLLHLSDPISALMSPASIQNMSADELQRNVIGTGPFKFVEWVPGDHITLEAFDDYWQGRPYLDQIVFRFIPDPNARTAQLQAGDVQMATTLVETQFAQLQTIPTLHVENHPSTRFNGIGIFSGCPPFDNKLVRQAVAHAIDRESIVNNVLLGVGEVNNQPLNRGTFGWNPNLSTEYEYDPERSRALLAEAGYPDGFDTVYSFTRVSGQPMQDAIQANLAAVGINVTLEQLESAAWTEKRNKQEHCLINDGWGAIFNDADFGLYQKFHSSSIPPNGANSYFFSNPELDRLLDEARAELDPEAREQLYWDAMDLIMEEAIAIPITRVNYVNGWSTDVHDVFQNAGDQWWFGKTWIEQ